MTAAHGLAGTAGLLRLAMRRDRVMVAGWLAALVLTTASSAKATIDLYGDAAAGVAAAHAVNTNAALVAMYGPIFDERSMGSLAIFKLVLLFGALMTILFVVLVRRHTRLEEESGRADLVSATATGPQAPLAAAIVQAGGLALLLGVLVALGNIATGLPTAGSFAFGMAWAGLALFATALTAVIAQLFSSARTVAGMVATVMATLYVARAAGDATDTAWLVWLSPFGWASRMRAYAGEQWWPMALFALAFGVGVALSFWLRSRRDLGDGLIAARPGSPTGTLTGYGSLVLRLHRPGLVGWCLGLFALGAVLGSIAPSAAQFAGSTEVQDMLKRMGGSGLLKDAFLAIETSFMAVAAAAYGVSVVNRAHTEEVSGRLENVLAGGVSRIRLYAWVVGFALVSSTALLACFGLGTGLAFGRAESDVADQTGRLLAAAVGQSPATWAIVALSALAFGVRSSWAPVGWVFLVGSVVVGQIGELLDLPSWVIKASPFAHMPKMPVEQFEVTGAISVIVGLCVVAVVGGALAFRRRDVG